MVNEIVKSDKTISKNPKYHEESCQNNCKHLWWHEPDIGEVTNLGDYRGYVCDGNETAGVVNLTSFPFKTKQDCYGQKNKIFSFDEFIEYGMKSEEAEIEEGKLVYFEIEHHPVFRENDDLYQLLIKGSKRAITPMCFIAVIDGEISIVA